MKTKPPRAKKSRLMWLILGVAILFILVLFYILRTMSAEGAVFAPVCQGQGVAIAAPYRAGSGLHPMIVIKAGKATSKVGAPLGWLSMSEDSIELVACAVPAEKYLIETCSYVGGSEVKRYGYKQDVKIYAAQTGVLIAAETVYGEFPRSCAQLEERSVRTLTGKSIRLGKWLNKFVSPTAPTFLGQPGISEKGIAITVLEVKWDAWSHIKTLKNMQDDSYYAPAPGEIYVLVSVQVKNTRQDPAVNEADHIEEKQFVIKSGSSSFQEANIMRSFPSEPFLKPQSQFTGSLAYKLPKSALEGELVLVYRGDEIVLSLK